MAASTEAPAHPREAVELENLQGPAAAFAGALARGRLHHAWLLTGPQGVGKASFAYWAAKQLLGAQLDPDGATISAQDPVARLVQAQSHPDLMVLEPAADRKSISVEDARRLPEFFSKAPASAPFRVAIIDTADELNLNAANAVLKTLEEPPPRGVLFLVSHAPGRLLATVRSRCRRLAFDPWPLDRLTRFVAVQTALDEAASARLAEMAGGAPGRALVLAATGALQIDASAQALLSRLPDADEAGLIALADSFRGGEGAARFALLLDRLAAYIHRGVTATAAAGASAGLDDWAGAWARLSRLPGEVEALNLDRADAFWSALGELRQAARARPLPC